MKKTITCILVSLAMLMGAISCELTGSIDKMKPLYKITDRDVIVDDKSAEATLNGVYESWRTGTFVGFMRHSLDMLTGTEGVAGGEGMPDYLENAIKTDDHYVQSNYPELYNVVNHASSLLSNIKRQGRLKGLTSARNAEIRGEAYCQRALAYLMLLRQYGEFADVTSQYGILLYGDEPIRENKEMERSTVADSYKAIVSDLDSAILLAPKNQPKHYRVGSFTAKALKARVMLYMKRFKEAAELSREVLKEAPGAGYSMEEDFEEMFKKSYESSEMIFALFSMLEGEEIFYGGQWYAATNGPTVTRLAKSQIKGKIDNRFMQTWVNPTGVGDGGGRSNEGDEGDEGDDESQAYPIRKYPYIDWVTPKQGSFYFMRLAEIHYILAEAEARLGNTSKAKAALKEVVCLPRAGYETSYVDAIPEGQLLKTILEQKWLELHTENNEEWFDLVRYRSWDKFKIAPDYVKSDARLLLPIPRKSLQANKKMRQNPGYSEN